MYARTAALDRLFRLSRTMEIVTGIGILLAIVLGALAFVIPELTRNLLMAKLGSVGAALPVTPIARLAAAAVIAVPLAVMLYGLWEARAMFREFAKGQVFTERAARHLRAFAITVIVQGPLGPLSSAALSIAVSLVNAGGERMHAIAFSLHDYFAVIIGGVLFALARAMREAARLADENASFV
jgi:Protein of unknown function (DUF2975)